MASSDAVVAARFLWITPEQAPALAHELVVAAAVSERPRVVRDVTHAIAVGYPALLPETVMAFAKQFPSLGAAAAGEAVRHEPSNALFYALTTVRVTPRYAGLISAATSAEVPANFFPIASTMARLYPESSQSIIFALGDALPDLQPFLERAKSLTASGRPVRPAANVVLATARDLVELDRAMEAEDEIPEPAVK